MSDLQPIVVKSADSPQLTSLEPVRFRPPRPGGSVEFVMDVTAEAIGGTMKLATVAPNLPGWSAFEIRCDEGPSIGGTDSAPAPLAYLSASVSFCMLTHLTYYIESHELSIRSLKIEQRLRFSTNERTRMPADAPVGACHGIEMNLIIESDAPEEDVRRLSETAKALCMAHHAIISPTPSLFGVQLNGRTLEPA